MSQCTSAPWTTSVSKSVERASMALAALTDGERCCRQGLLELGRSPDEGRALEAELVLEGLLEVLLDGGAGAFRVEDDVAAVDVGPHVVVAEALGDPFEPRHLDLPLAEVHRAQEADPDRHGR